MKNPKLEHMIEQTSRTLYDKMHMQFGEDHSKQAIALVGAFLEGLKKEDQMVAGAALSYLRYITDGVLDIGATAK